MKHFYLLICLFAVQVCFSQTRDPRADRFNYEPQEIIVKLRDNISAGVSYNKSGEGSTSKDIGELLELKGKVKSSKVLFNEVSVRESLKRKQSQLNRRLSQSNQKRAENGYEEEDIITLNNIFLLELENEQENIEELISDLKKNPSVEFAEPNYRYSINDFTINSEVYTEADLKKMRAAEKPAVYAVPNDALYSQQSNIAAVNLDQVWERGITGDSTQVIAILDTGVDYTHPDLEPNIWINEAELNGVAGYDDDGNGYVDDIHGWDFINLDGEPLDDNMHGTHVAGIAGAVGNNELGITGATWNVKLLPVKVFQSNGVGNATTIAQGIDYAAQNGATVINMSFGSTAESMTMKAALDNAYATAVLVASAGNSGICIGPERCPDGKLPNPSYPGAYTFVIGVQDQALYSNYDQDGPIYSGYSNLLNYETRAPGSAILSSVPGGGYRKLTGTSMSAPLVAGGIALYLQAKPKDSKELLFGNLINTSSSFVDFKAALDVVPSPELRVLSAIKKDTLSGQNGNGYLESGEVIDIFPLIKNYWGPTDDVRVGINFAEFEDNTKAEILIPEIVIGSITAYAELQDLTKSLKIKLAEGLANNVNIKFDLKVWSGPDQQYLSSTEFVINVKNAILLFGMHSEDLTLTSNREYLVPSNLVLTDSSTMTIEPGTIIRIADNTTINFLDSSNLHCVGTKEKPIVFINENIGWGGLNLSSGGVKKVSFTELRGIYSSNTINNHKNVTFSDVLITHCYNSSYGPALYGSPNNNFYERINYTDNFYRHEIAYQSHLSSYNNGNFIRNEVAGGPPEGVRIEASSRNLLDSLNIFDNVINLNAAPYTTGSSAKIKPYLGSSSHKIFRKEIIDILNDGSRTMLINTDSISPIPYAGAHGIVWKVLVNGKDAQDEYELIDPVGVGSNEFQVHFNRPMDTLVTPQISYGVREPYNQKIISEQGSWSADGKVFTVNHEVKIGAADGINRIRVQGARDLDYFEIPVEDFRFNMLVQSAGSASSGFFATPELGKITLEWEEPSADLLEDVLGYNMYRHEAITDSTFTEPVKINETLISNVSYSDFDVEEGEKYFYQYKILRTNFEESDFSKTVSASPLTSKLGDSNGDFSVNVLDLVQDVDYILGNNPQPFIFKAADVNADLAINVLDIVGTVDIINSPSTASMSVSATNPSLAYYSSEAIGEVNFYWEEDNLYMESEHPVGAFQLAFEEGFSYEINEELSSFEWSNYKQEDSRIVMMYSFNGTAIKAGKTKILSRNSADSNLEIEKAVVGTPKGEKLAALFSDKDLSGIEAPEQTDKLQVVKFWPNPTDGIINLQYYLPETMDAVVVSVFNLLGTRIMSTDSLKNTAGPGEKEFNLSNLTPGIYLFVVDAVRAGEIKHREAKKIIIE